jgi:hypothetical protein
VLKIIYDQKKKQNEDENPDNNITEKTEDDALKNKKYFILFSV